MTNTITVNNQHYFSSTYWWFDLNNKDSFSFFNLDSFYDDQYFKNDHLGEDIIEGMIYLMNQIHLRLTNKELESVIELGCGGGWITERIYNHKFKIQAVEGSLSGYNKCINRGLKDVVLKHDLRLPLNLNKKYNMCICTEVAEHIEPPFSSVLINNIITHSDIAWFSFNKNDGHHHHSNPQPDKFWINLFDFFNWGYLKPKPEYKHIFNERLDYIFYNRNIFGNLDENLINDL
jgi:hypothetical protein